MPLCESRLILQCYRAVSIHYQDSFYRGPVHKVSQAHSVSTNRRRDQNHRKPSIFITRRPGFITANPEVNVLLISFRQQKLPRCYKNCKYSSDSLTCPAQSERNPSQAHNTSYRAQKRSQHVRTGLPRLEPSVYGVWYPGVLDVDVCASAYHVSSNKSRPLRVVPINHRIQNCPPHKRCTRYTKVLLSTCLVSSLGPTFRNIDLVWTRVGDLTFWSS